MVISLNDSDNSFLADSPFWDIDKTKSFHEIGNKRHIFFSNSFHPLSPFIKKYTQTFFSQGKLLACLEDDAVEKELLGRLMYHMGGADLENCLL